MALFRKMKLRTKLLLVGLLSAVVPLFITLSIVFYQNRIMNKTSSEKCLELAISGLDPVVKGAHSMCTSLDTTSQQLVNSSLNVACSILHQAGRPGFSQNETVAWKAVNQFNQQTISISLPKMKVGDTWLGRNTDLSIPSPVVDDVKKMLDVTCTIFQRMNNEGDMLRVCTNVQKSDGTRAIGTYIPRINPDGKPNPVITSILQGETYRGRAFVVNAWYLTAYEPIFDSSRNVIGVLYVGIPEERVIAGLKEEIKKQKIGKTGYVYVLDSKGNYIISKDGKRDGENIWESKDNDGNLFIQEICSKALALEHGKIAEQRYPWKNQDDPVARTKIVRIMYFQPWDWIISAGANEDELTESQTYIRAIGSRVEKWLILTAILVILGASIASFFIAGSITRPLNEAVKVANQLAEGDLSMEIEVRSQDETGQLLAAMQRMVERIRDIMAEINLLTRSAVEGKLATRADASRHGGEFGRIIDGVNKTLDAVISPLNIAAEYVDRISKGDIPSRITEEYQGDFNEIRNNLNTLIDSMNEMTVLAGEIADGNLAVKVRERSSKDKLMQSMALMVERVKGITGEINLLTRSAMEGKLDTRADASRHGGEFGRIIDGVNKTLDAVISPLNMAAEYVDRISKGDIPSRITEEYQGDFNEIRNNLNTLIDSMNEITMLAGEIADGNLAVKVRERSPKDKLMQSMALMVQRLSEVAAKLQSISNQVISGSQQINHTFRTLTEANSIFYIISGIDNT